MRIALGVFVLAVPAVPLTATAGPITAGVSLGLAQSKADAQADSNQTIGLFGRLAFTSRLAGQLELARYQTDATSNNNMRTGTALLVVDLAESRRWVPTLAAGIGLDRADSGCPTCTWEGQTTGHHIEGGLGLEYRAEGGFTLGADLRMGGRSIDHGQLQPLQGGVIAFAPSHFSEGEYRSARVTLGIRF